jgi:hypothetical protein
MWGIFSVSLGSRWLWRFPSSAAGDRNFLYDATRVAPGVIVMSPDAHLCSTWVLLASIDHSTTIVFYGRRTRST